MYKNFFGLRENPFSLSPDPRFLFLTPQIQEAMEQLTYGISSRKGLILLTGEVGTGKTTLVNYLLDWLRQRKMPTAFIFNSHLSVDHLFDFILNDFGISTDFRLKTNMLLRLNEWLIERCRAGTIPVLIVDEAQGLSFELLEEIRLLLNLETASAKLLQIVLVGQPELQEKLKRPEMRQIRQRIALRCYTSPLTLAESRGYIADRLRIAGAHGNPLFASDAEEAVHSYSRGIPRVMNLLCEHALINAYVEHLNPVPAPMVEEAARDFLLDEFRPLAARTRVDNHLESKVSIMQPLLAPELLRPFTSHEARSQQEPLADLIPAPYQAAVKKSAFFAKSGVATTALKGQAHAGSDEGVDTFHPIPELVPAGSGRHPRQSAAGNAPDAFTRQADCATELMTAMARMLDSASSSAARRIDLPKVNHEPSPVALLSRNAVAQSRFPAAFFRKISRSVQPVKMLARQWSLEFKRDWNVMIGSIPIAQVKKSLLQWLSKPMSSQAPGSK